MILDPETLQMYRFARGLATPESHGQEDTAEATFEVLPRYGLENGETKL